MISRKKNSVKLFIFFTFIAINTCFGMQTRRLSFRIKRIDQTDPPKSQSLPTPTDLTTLRQDFYAAALTFDRQKLTAVAQELQIAHRVDIAPLVEFATTLLQKKITQGKFNLRQQNAVPRKTQERAIKELEKKQENTIKHMENIIQENFIFTLVLDDETLSIQSFSEPEPITQQNPSSICNFLREKRAKTEELDRLNE